MTGGGEDVEPPGSVATASLIEAVGLERMYEDGRVQALRGVSFKIEEGEYVAILGPSGSGKSSLLQILGALDRPTGGDVLFRGGSYARLPNPARFRAEKIGFIFQSFHLFPTLSALDNVQLPMVELPWSAVQRRERAAELLKAVGLMDRGGHLPSQLSGGERQRVALARSLANKPSLLLADEPTGNLDTGNAARVMRMLEEVHGGQGTTLLVVTHNEEVAARAGRVLRLRDGQLVADQHNR